MLANMHLLWLKVHLGNSGYYGKVVALKLWWAHYSTGALDSFDALDVSQNNMVTMLQNVWPEGADPAVDMGNYLPLIYYLFEFWFAPTFILCQSIQFFGSDSFRILIFTFCFILIQLF